MEKYFSDGSRISTHNGAIVFDNIKDNEMPESVHYRIRFFSEQIYGVSIYFISTKCENPDVFLFVRKKSS